MNELLLGGIGKVPLGYKAIDVVGFDARRYVVIKFCSKRVYRSFSFLTGVDNTFFFSNYMMDFFLAKVPWLLTRPINPSFLHIQRFQCTEFKQSLEMC